MCGDGAASLGDNRTDSSRVSFDFRAIRMRDFHWSQVPPPGDPRANEVRWSILDAFVFGHGKDIALGCVASGCIGTMGTGEHEIAIAGHGSSLTEAFLHTTMSWWQMAPF